MCRLRLTLGLVRKSAVSGNSTGGRVTSDDVEAAPSGRGLWMGEVTGLRLGDAPAVVRGSEVRRIRVTLSVTIPHILELTSNSPNRNCTDLPIFKKLIKNNDSVLT